MNWQWHPALEEPLDRSISWFGSLSAEWSRIRILDDRLLLRISVQVPDGPVDLVLEIANWRLNRSNWATVGNKDPIGGLPFLTVVSRKMLQTKLQWPANAMLHFVRSYSTDRAFLMLFGNCALVYILIRGFLNSMLTLTQRNPLLDMCMYYGKKPDVGTTSGCRAGF